MTHTNFSHMIIGSTIECNFVIIVVAIKEMNKKRENRGERFANTADLSAHFSFRRIGHEMKRRRTVVHPT